MDKKQFIIHVIEIDGSGAKSLQKYTCPKAQYDPEPWGVKANINNISTSFPWHVIQKIEEVNI